MAISAGSITINETTGEHTGSGMAFEILDAWWTDNASTYDEAHFPRLAVETAEEWLARRVAMIVLVKSKMVALFGGIANAIVTEITTNAEVTVTVGANDAGLQRLPDPPDAGAATVAPAAPVTLTGRVS